MNQHHRKQARLTTFLRRALQPCLAICALAPTLAPHHAAAATTYVWQEGAGGSWDFTSANWNDANHRWNGGSTSAINNIASFGAVAPTGGDTAITVNGAIKLAGVTFTNGNINSNYYDIQQGTGTLTFTGKAVVTATAGTAGLISTSLSTDTSSAHSTDTLTFTADSTTASAGQIFLFGNNTNYSVPSLTITGGALVSVNRDSALPNVATVVGVTQIAGNDSTGPGNLDIFGPNQTIASLSGAANGTITNDGSYATLTVGGPKTSQSSTTYAGVITDTSIGEIATTNHPTPIGGLGLTVQAPVGGYILVLTGTANNYHGFTVVGDGANAATLQAGATNAFSANSGVNVLANGTLDLNGFSQSIADLDGTGVGTVTNKKQGTTATLTLTGDGKTDTLTSAANLIDHTTNSAFGTLALTKSGGYTQVLAGTNTYGGATNLNDGTLAAGSATGLSANSTYTVSSPGILDLNGFNASIGSLSGNGTVENGSGTVTGSTPSNFVTLTTGNDGTNTTFSGLIENGTGTLALTKTGLGTFTVTDSSNTYTGGTNINQGVLSFSAVALSTGLVTFTGNSTLQYQAGNTQDVSSVNGLKINDGVTATIDTNGNNVTFATAFQTGPLATAALTKIGSGTLTLGTNTYTGGTTIDGGTLAISADGNLGGASGGVTLNGGTLEATAGLTTTRTISLGASGGTISTSGNTGLYLNGLITGSGPLNLSGSTSDEAVIFLEGTADNTYTGLTTIQTGFVELNAAGHVAIPGNLQVDSGAKLDIDANEQIASAATVTVNGTLAFNAGTNVQQTIGTLNGDGFIATVSNNTATLVVGAGNFSGVITDGDGPMALTKQGPGTLILSNGHNGYSGATTVNGGTLELDGSNISGGSNVTVNSGGALAGTGNVGGTVTINAGGFLNPGTSSTPGTLTTGTLVLTTGATSTFRVGGATSDLVAVNGSFTLAGNLSIIGDPGLAPGIYTLITFTGNIFDPSGFNNVAGAAGFSTSYEWSDFVGGGGEVSLLVDYLGTPQYWDGTHTTATGSIAGGSGTWNKTPTNWTSSDGSTNSAWQGGTALFSGPGGTVTLGGPISAQALFFNSTGYTLTGSTLTLAGPDPAIDVVNSGTTTTISSVIAGKAGLAATGAGTLILTNGANTYTGGTTVTSGTLQLGTSTKAAKINAAGAIAIGSGGTLSIVNVSGNTLANAVSNGLLGIGTLDIDSAHTNTLSGALTDGGTGQLALTQNGTGTTILTNSGNTYSGVTTVSSGHLQIGTSSLAGSIGASSPVSVAQGSLVLVKVSGGVLDNNISASNRMFGYVTANSATALTLSGILSDGSGALQIAQSGAGTTTLTGIDTYSGATAITAGTLQVGNGSTGNLTGNTAIGVSGTGALAIDLANNSTFTLNVSLSGSGTALKATESGTNTLAGTIFGTGSFDQTGTGTTILTGTNTYSGATNVHSDGTLQLGTTGSPGALNAASAVSLTDGGTFVVVNPAGNVFANNVSSASSSYGYLQIDSANTITLSGKVTNGAGQLELDQVGSGTTILTNAANAYSAATAVTDGTLQIGTTATPGSIGASTVYVTIGTFSLVNVVGNTLANSVENDYGNVGTLLIDSAKTNTLSGVLSDGGAGQLALTQGGSGRTILTKAETYTGATDVNAGALEVNGSLAAGSPVTVASSATLGGHGTIAGPVTLDSGGNLEPGVGLTGAAGTTLHAASVLWNGGGDITLRLGAHGVSDELALSGALTKGSASGFNLDLVDDGMTSTSADYTLLTFQSTTFQLSDFNLELPANVTGTLVETATSLVLDNAMDDAPTPGEDAALAGAPVNADSTEPAVSTPDTIVVTPTPEPGSATLLSLGGIALLGWRRRRRG